MATAALAAASSSTLPTAPPIPSAFTESLKSWWSTGEKNSAISEERLLRRLPFYTPDPAHPTDPSSPVVAHRQRVDLTKPGHYLNTVAIKSTKTSEDAPPPAIMLHGYGAGLGFFYRNFPALADWVAQRQSAVYALDWLGMGRSARVPFSVKAKRTDVHGRVTESESFFVDSLEDWRAKMGLEQMTLIGHSLGAYFSVVYALKYPERVNKLILISPAGVPRGPEGDPSREVTDVEPAGEAPAQAATKAKIQEIQAEQQQVKKSQSRQRKVFSYLWEQGWSPFQVVRSFSVWAPMVVAQYSSRRFTGLSEEETREMHDYILNITLAKGSGEYCISHILAPGAHARMPLVDRISALKIPVTFIYGEHDWMDPRGGEDSVERLRQAGNGQGRMYVVGRAGHHVYLDNPKAVNDLLMKELDRPVSAKA
ncbi:Alpha/Beta hydrolase protein [Schizophyllum amplum]|uniref:Alpha/Beta hydrolase protein n=1 Tax=Schizophyllum amplum TaxID=97359 RepID=A0A550CUC6_9AGAR|nr:Alpha/Beta hydrolase protein [Auriculariopsis ampla]